MNSNTKIMIKVFIKLLLLFAISHQLNAQTYAVSGHVFAFKNMALKNIKVTAKKSQASVLTDSLGRFTLVCEKKDKLVFEGNGFAKVFKKLGKKDEYVKIKMMFIESQKNREMAIGYGHVSEAELTNAVNNLSDYNNDFCNYTDVYEILVGRFPGVQIVNTGGSKKVLVRGVSSTSSNIYALLIVDGVPVDDLGFLPPASVKSINVLKDGAIYGSRGANGVVIITTVSR